jgi:hypothetical protein
VPGHGLVQGDFRFSHPPFVQIHPLHPAACPVGIPDLEFVDRLAAPVDDAAMQWV